MGSDSILAGIGATVLAVTLLVCGFAACCLPVTTASLAGAVSTGADSPYTHEQLVSLAQETRAFTVDAHSSMEEACESLAADVVAAAREASAEGAPKYSQWTQQAKQVLGDAEGEGGAMAADGGAAAGADGTALETMDALAKVSDLSLIHIYRVTRPRRPPAGRRRGRSSPRRTREARGRSGHRRPFSGRWAGARCV